MNKKTRLFCLLALFAAGALGGQTAVTTASSNGTIRESGSTTNPWFHTAQGPGNFASYAISSFRFTAGDFGVGAVAGITGATISYTQRNAAFTSDGPVSFHVTFDTIVSGGDYSGLAHAGTGTGVNDTQFSDMPLTQVLGEGTFTEVADGTVDTYVLNFTGTLESSLVEAINSGNAFSIILATSDSDAAVTYAGIENNAYPDQIDLSLTVIPVPVNYTVTFDLGEHGTRVGGGELVQTVEQGGAATAPEVDADVGWTFTGWDADFENITSDTTIAARYDVAVYTVTFDLDDRGTRVGGGQLTQEVEHGGSAEAPEVEPEEGWIFAGWDQPLDTIVSGVAIRAVYEESEATEWAGFPIDADGSVMTEAFGRIFPLGNFVFMDRLEAWVFLPEAFVSVEGAWIFGPGWETLSYETEGWVYESVLGMYYVDSGGFVHIPGVEHWIFPTDRVEEGGRWVFIFADPEIEDARDE